MDDGFVGVKSLQQQNNNSDEIKKIKKSKSEVMLMYNFIAVTTVRRVESDYINPSPYFLRRQNE